MTTTSKRQAARDLSEELLEDIELSRLPPVAQARKTLRLARLLDDAAAMKWLHYEVSGYPTNERHQLGRDAWQAAERSNRIRVDEDGKRVAYASGSSLATVQGTVEGLKAQLAASTNMPGLTIGQIVAQIGSQERILEGVVGAFYDYVAARHQELRFGAAVESAFEVVRDEVDRTIASLVPDALPMVSAAFENATSSEPEHWANAASTCRRLLKAVADYLRPPGPDAQRPDGRPVKMGDSNYINRLIAWVAEHSASTTRRDLTSAELADLGRRLDAVDDAGHKGAHDRVTRFEASRFMASTYLVLGDLLRLRPHDPEANDSGAAEVAQADPTFSGDTFAESEQE